MKETYLAVHFTKGVFFCQFVNTKVEGLMPRYYLLAGDTSHVSIFSLHNIKISNQHRSALPLTYRFNVYH